MKLNAEEKKQKVCVLLGDLEEFYRDRMWLSDMVDGTVGMAKQHYQNEMRKCDAKIEKVKQELTRLRANH
jgi:hypothetical protein